MLIWFYWALLTKWKCMIKVILSVSLKLCLWMSQCFTNGCCQTLILNTAPAVRALGPALHSWSPDWNTEIPTEICGNSAWPKPSYLYGWLWQLGERCSSVQWACNSSGSQYEFHASLHLVTWNPRWNWGYHIPLKRCLFEVSWVPSAVSGRDTFCSTGKVAAVVSMLTGHKNYLRRASPSALVGLPAVPAAVALAGCTKGGMCFNLLADI